MKGENSAQPAAGKGGESRMTGKDLFAALSYVDDALILEAEEAKACAPRVSCAGRPLGRGARRLRLPARRLGVCGGAPAVRGQHVERNGRCGGRRRAGGGRHA